MMLKLGTDIVYIPRIQSALDKFGERFLQRVYTKTEQQDCTKKSSQSKLMIPQLAGRWAAKEAVVKALGTGFQGISYTDVEVQRQSNGAPCVHLYGRAAEKLATWHNYQWLLSISHEKDYAIATAILMDLPGHK